MLVGFHRTSIVHVAVELIVQQVYVFKVDIVDNNAIPLTTNINAAMMPTIGTMTEFV
jgi:hypothetical protein